METATISPLERAARAAAEEYGEDWDNLPDLNPHQNGEPDRQQYVDMARAVLQALREPSSAMLDAGEYDDNGKPGVWFGGHLLEESWGRMIDAALEA